MPVFQLKGEREFSLEVSGESHYQKNFEIICGPRSENGENRLVQAILIPEPNNRFDKNAVRVDVEGKIVGYLPRDEARDYKKLYTALKLPPTVIIKVDAQIRGGWRRRSGKEGAYGIWLDFPTSNAAVTQLKVISREVNKKGCLGLLLLLPAAMTALFLLAH